MYHEFVFLETKYISMAPFLDETQLREERKAAMIGGAVSKVIYTDEQKALRWSSFKNMDPESMFALHK